MRKTHYGSEVRSWIDEEGIRSVNKTIHQFTDIKTMVCHGCRSGVEVSLFMKFNPEAEVIGTDVYKGGFRLDKKHFRHIDFDLVPEEWIGYFDAVYSNSIDHSRDPILTLNSWRLELKPTGICYVTFYWGRGVSRSDCFQLNRERPTQELVEIANQVGLKILHTSDGYTDGYHNHCVDVVMGREGRIL